jgi:hypothetical protein
MSAASQVYSDVCVSLPRIHYPVVLFRPTSRLVSTVFDCASWASHSMLLSTGAQESTADAQASTSSLVRYSERGHTVALCPGIIGET